MDKTPPNPIRVVFALLPHSTAIDWAGPAEALRIANQWLAANRQPARFRIEFASPEPQTLSSVGVTLASLAPLPERWDGPGWIVLVGQPGGALDLRTPQARALLRWLRVQPLAEGRLELVTICAGAMIAAHAGLLDGRRATTHHLYLDDLRKAAPRCEVLGNRVFVLDAPVFSSAGMITGIDLMLHRIGALCGDALAARVAQAMVMPLRRGPHDPQLSPFLAHRDHLHSALHRVQDAVSAQPQTDWTVPRMAALAHTSSRHLARLFAEHAGVTPLAYLRRLRLASAQAALQAGQGVTQAAAMAGFNSDTQLRRAWRQFGLPGSPSASWAQG